LEKKDRGSRVGKPPPFAEISENRGVVKKGGKIEGKTKGGIGERNNVQEKT